MDPLGCDLKSFFVLFYSDEVAAYPYAGYPDCPCSHHAVQDGTVWWGEVMNVVIALGRILLPPVKNLFRDLTLDAVGDHFFFKTLSTLHKENKGLPLNKYPSLIVLTVFSLKCD